MKLVEKCKSFYKEIKTDLLADFLDKNNCNIDEIIAYGHSFAIDYEYFDLLIKRYPSAHWCFYVKGDEQEHNTKCLIVEYGINNYQIVIL